MRRSIITIILSLALVPLVAQQTPEEVLKLIETNNTTLQALNKRMEARQVSNKTGIYLSNPEVEFNYLFGNPSAIGNRTDISVTQSFDFPTAYVYEKQLAEMKNDQLLLEFKSRKREILLQAKQVLIELTYSNALIAEVQKRQEDAQNIARAYQLKIEHGDCSQLELNKAKLYMLNAQNDLKQLRMNREELLSRLTGLNGGKAIAYGNSSFETLNLPADFESWVQQAEAHNPMLQWLKQEVDINQKEVQLSKAKQLPSLQAGYMSEKVIGEQFQGITVGLSIPLWENKNKVKASKLNALAAESSRADQQIQFYEKLKALYARARSLQTSLMDYENQYGLFSNADLLKKALDTGEISLIEYLYETAMLYDGVDRIWELKKAMNLALAELDSYRVRSGE